jgi:enamine deaminase RidA (YjgF/YER057c/UK114 family)
MPIDALNQEAFKATSDWLHFSQAVKSNGMLFLSGVIGIDDNAKVPEDAETEFRYAFEDIGRTLALAGIGWDSIVEMTTFHVSGLAGDDMTTFIAVRDKFLRSPWCAWTAVQVTGLALEGARVEIKVVAQLR